MSKYVRNLFGIEILDLDFIELHLLEEPLIFQVKYFCWNL